MYWMSHFLHFVSKEISILLIKNSITATNFNSVPLNKISLVAVLWKSN